VSVSTAEVVGASVAEPAGRGFALSVDERLAREAAEGQRRAFTAIFERHHQELYRYCHALVGNRSDAEDALQGAMLAALAALPGEQRDIALRPWLYRVAHNEAISIVRRRGPVVDPSALSLPAPDGIDAIVGSRQRLRELVLDLRALPERQRSALVMRELSGLSYREIADVLETTHQAARQLVYETRQALAELNAGREMDCASVRQAISGHERRILRGRRVRAHLRACAGCRDFRAAISTRRADLQALCPPLPAAAASSILASVLGGAGGAKVAGLASGTAASGGAAAGAGSGATSAGLGGALGAGAAGKAAALIAAAAVGAGAFDAARVIHLPTGGGRGPTSSAEAAGGGGSASAPAAAKPASAPAQRMDAKGPGSTARGTVGHGARVNAAGLASAQTGRVRSAGTATVSGGGDLGGADADRESPQAGSAETAAAAPHHQNPNAGAAETGGAGTGGAGTGGAIAHHQNGHTAAAETGTSASAPGRAAGVDGKGTGQGGPSTDSTRVPPAGMPEQATNHPTVEARGFGLSSQPAQTPPVERPGAPGKP
jgi:RNA polymerase sigma factor (sigma-70 family)